MQLPIFNVVTSCACTRGLILCDVLWAVIGVLLLFDHHQNYLKFYAQNDTEGLFSTLVLLLTIVLSTIGRRSLWDIRMSFIDMNFPRQDNNTVCPDYNDTFTNWHVSY